MAKNKIITSQGNVQFINSKGKTISMHPMHCYAVYQDDTVSFLFIYMKEYSGQAFFASQFEDLEVDGETYDSIDALKEAIAEAFAKAGAQARTEIVDELPETGYTNTIYLLPKEHGEGYDEYIYNEEKGWQLIGDTDIEFERYLQKDDFNEYSAATEEKITFISGAVDDNASDIQFLSGAVDTEISDREAADAVISGVVDTLSTNLSNEVSRAQNAEQTLQNNINTVNSRVDSEQIARANADNALSGAIDSVDDKIDTLSGEVQTMGDEAIVDAAYVSSSTTIDFYNASGAVVAQVDATDFIKDGMIEDVRIETISGVTYLVIDFNTASGKEDIKIPLTDIFNPDNYYDKTAVDGFISDLEAADSVISGAVDNVSSDLATEAQRAQNAEGVLSGAIDTKLAISDFNTYSGAVETALNSKANSADVYSKSEVYTKAEVDEAIAEIDLSDYYTKTETDGKLADKADLSALTEDERVWGEALNDLNSRINTVSGDVAGKADVTAVTQVNNALTSHTANTNVHVTSAEKATWNAKSDFSGDYNDLTNKLSAGTNITIVDNVISATGGGGGGTVESAITSGSTNAVESKAIWSATTFNKGVLLTFNGNMESTNYPEGCGKLVVGNIGFGSCDIHFRNDEGRILGNIIITNFDNISVDTSDFEGASYEISGTTVIINYPSTGITFVDMLGETGWTYTAVVEGAWVNENTYMKPEVDAIASGLQNNINSKLDATAYTPTVVDSALNVASQNPVQNQALYSELRIDNGETETTLTFENEESTNYPNGCTKLNVEVVGSGNYSRIDFLNDNYDPLGNIRIDNNNWQGISVNVNFDGASYEISGTTVIITYPTVTSVTKISVDNSGYVYKAIVASPTTPLKDQVVANTTSLGGKQDTLVSGTNIKTINNTSILGSGNIDIQGGGSSYTAGDGIDITNDVISVTGKADTSAVTAIQDSLSGYVTTDTEQIISGRKIFTFTSSTNKAIEFKQTDDSSKVGFRVRTSAATNNELASFEFRPNTFTVDGVQHPLLYFGHYRNTNTANAGVQQTVIGFRQYDQKNIAAYHYLFPLPEKAKAPFGLTTTFKDYYAPMGFKNGSTMITADNTGVVDLSSELDGLKLKKLTQAEYDALVTKDSNTLYIISD